MYLIFYELVVSRRETDKLVEMAGLHNENEKDREGASEEKKELN